MVNLSCMIIGTSFSIFIDCHLMICVERFSCNVVRRCSFAIKYRFLIFLAFWNIIIKITIASIAFRYIVDIRGRSHGSIKITK